MNTAKNFIGQKTWATAIAAIVLGLAAIPAQAMLEWRVDGGVGQRFVICDAQGLGPCVVPAGFVLVAGGDTDGSAESITVNTGTLNALLTGKFDFVNAGASDNIATATTLSVLSQTSQLNIGPGAADTLIIEATRDGWSIPVGNPRTLTNGPSATLTSTGTGTVSSTGFNDPGNVLFGTTFATPTSVFLAGAGACGPLLGGVSTCNDLTQLGGIVEPIPYSLTNRQTISSPPANQGANYLQTDSTTKFATPQQVPEPASLLLLGVALASLVFMRRFKS